MRLEVRILALLALSVLLVPVGSADGPGEPSKEKKGKAASSEKASEPAPKPAPKPAATAAPGPPKAEIAVGYSFVRFNPENSNIIKSFSLNGGGGSIAYYFTRAIGIQADFQGYGSLTRTFAFPTGSTLCPTGCTGNVQGNLFTYNVGPIFKYRAEHFEPFVETLFGGAHSNVYGNLLTACAAACVTAKAPSNNAFDFIIGGGIDIPVNKTIAIRPAQFDYILTRFGNNFTNGNTNQSNFRYQAGIVFRLGGSPPPPPPNRPPAAACSADARSVVAGTGDSVSVRAQASDPDNDPLTYAWSASGGKVDGSGPSARWSSAGLGPGDYTVTARVDDGRGGTASCSATIRVDPPPNRPPVMTCSAERSSVMAGERVGIAATASDPDNDPLSYAWRANGGQIIGSGKSVQLDTTGLAPGTYTVSGRVDDGRGGAADCTSAVEVKTPPTPPQSSKLNECFFRASSARVDNVCKRILDDVALRLKSEPRASLGIVSFADEKEAKGDKLAKDRGASTVKYLGEKGVDASRITVHTGTGQKGAGKENRRTDLIFVPEGASF